MSLRHRIRQYIDESIDRADKSKALEVVETSWHFRLYKWWMTMGGRNKIGYRENFCHYVRVVLIWVPLFWFFKHRLWNTFVRPWMLALAAAFLAFLTAVYILVPELFWQGVLVVGFFTAVVLLVAGTTLFDEYMKRHHYTGWRNFGEKLSLILIVVLMVVFFWVVIPAGVLIYLDGQTEKRYQKGLLEWFFTKAYLKVVFPWMVVLTIAIALSVYFFGGEITFWVVAAIIGLILGIVAILALIIGLLILNDKTRRWRREKIIWPIQDRISARRVNALPKPVKPKGTPVWQLAFAFILSKKRKICPFIKLPKFELPNNRPTTVEYYDW